MNYLSNILPLATVSTFIGQAAAAHPPGFLGQEGNACFVNDLCDTGRFICTPLSEEFTQVSLNQSANDQFKIHPTLFSLITDEYPFVGSMLPQWVLDYLPVNTPMTMGYSHQNNMVMGLDTCTIVKAPSELGEAVKKAFSEAITEKALDIGESTYLWSRLEPALRQGAEYLEYFLNQEIPRNANFEYFGLSFSAPTQKVIELLSVYIGSLGGGLSHLMEIGYAAINNNHLGLANLYIQSSAFQDLDDVNLGIIMDEAAYVGSRELFLAFVSDIRFQTLTSEDFQRLVRKVCLSENINSEILDRFMEHPCFSDLSGESVAKLMSTVP